MSDDLERARPWKGNGVWFGDVAEWIENEIVYLKIEPGKLGCHTVVVSCRSKELERMCGYLANLAVNHVIESPGLYGLKAVE